VAKKPQYHISQHGMLSRCAAQYEFRYVKGLIIPPAVAAITGSGTHRSIDTNLSHKIETGELVPLEQAQQVARDYVAAEFERGAYFLSAEDRQAKSTQAYRDEAVDMAVALSGLHYQELAPVIQPTHVERKWALSVPGLSHDLAGTLDIQEGLERIRDTKTAARAPSAGEADQSDQLTIYDMAVYVLDGAMVEELTIDALVKTKKPKVVIQTTHRTQEHFDALMDCIAVSLRQIDAGIFPPTGKGSWCCSPKWCGYWSQCKYVRGFKQFQMKGADDE